MKRMQQDTEWSAQWVWTPGKLREPIHVAYFRKELNLKKASRRAVLHCAADSKYRLWVNGEYLGFGDGGVP